MNVINSYSPPSTLAAYEAESIPFQGLFTKILSIVFEYLKKDDVMHTYQLNNACKNIIKDRFEMKKMNGYLKNHLDAKIKSIYEIQNIAERNFEEGKLHRHAFLQETIDHALLELHIPFNDSNYQSARNFIFDFFSNQDLPLCPITRALILKQFAIDLLDRGEMKETIKIVQCMPKLYSKDHVINLIFNHLFFSGNDFNNSHTFYINKSFLKLLLEEKKTNLAFKIADQFKKSVFETEIVTFVLRKLFFQQNFEKCLKFTTKQYCKLDYLLMIPKLYLERGMVQSAIRFAKKVDTVCVLYDNEFINPYNYVLELIMDYQLRKKKFYEAWDIIHLIYDHEKRDEYLNDIFRICLMRGHFNLAKHIASTIEDPDQRNIAIYTMREFACNQFLKKNKFYLEIDTIISNVNENVQSECIKLAIKNCEVTKKLNFNPYKIYLDEAPITPLEIEYEIYKSVISHYIYWKSYFRALKVACTIQNYRFRSEQLYLITKAILNSKYNQLEGNIHKQLALHIFKLIDDPLYKSKTENLLKQLISKDV